jgi:hypothetical protein
LNKVDPATAEVSPLTKSGSALLCKGERSGGAWGERWVF